MTGHDLACLVADARRDISDADRCLMLHVEPSVGQLHRRLREVTDALAALSTPPANDVREATVMQNARYLLDVLDGIPGPPFEMAVLDAHGRVGIAYADEDAVLGIQRLAYEDESNNPATVREEDFPMIRLVPASQSGGRS